MDWITGLQRAVDYMEEHLLEDICYEDIAAESFSSVEQSFDNWLTEQTVASGAEQARYVIL